MTQCYWSRLDGNDEMTWADADLTPLGVNQALAANKFWSKTLVEEQIPAPQTYYTSPLQRCLATAHFTFSGLELPIANPFKPLVKELLREDIGVHTCDRRSTKSQIKERWPDYDIEDGFSETDLLWDPDYRESESAHVYRLKLLLDDVFVNDESTFVSFSSHSGSIAALLKGVGHREFSLQTGGVIPLFLRIHKNKGSRPAETLEPPTKPPVCPPPGRS
jgi:broad specificity phosphatase PhoE